jgi:phosphoribosylcarboxyaminoimidazole (NCAIR) mutase
MSNGPIVATLVISSANLLATLGIAYALLKTKQQVDTKVEDLQKKTNKTVSKLRNALEDLEV